MSDTDVLLSVVIPTYNRRSTIKRVIQPVLDDSSTGEVVIVVDGSTDGTSEFLTDWAKVEKRIRVLEQENAGQAAARIHGVKMAQFSTVVLLDDDVEARPGLITGHARWHSGVSNLVVVGYMPTVIPTPRQPGQAPTILYSEDYESVCRLYEADSNAVFTHFWAGNVSMRRSSAIELADLPGERIRYHEDLSFGLRCQLAGLQPVFDRSLAAQHFHVRNMRGFAEECRLSGESRAILITRFPAATLELDPFVTLTSVERMVVKYLAGPCSRRFSARVLMATCWLTGHCRLWRIETMTARAIRLIQMTSGYEGVVRTARNVNT